MDFTISPALDALRARIAGFVERWPVAEDGRPAREA